MTVTQNNVLDLIFGRWRSQTLYAGVKLGIFETLSTGGRSSAEIAGELSLDPCLCSRLLRALATLELLREESDNVYSITDAGRFLLADHPQTLRGITLLEEGPEHYALWKHLPDMIRDGKQNAFVREFGEMAFDHAARDSSYAQVFDEAMSSYSAAQTNWVLEALDEYDLSRFSHLCDIAGGHGHLLTGFLNKYPHLRGTVLERPEVIADESRLWGNKLGLNGRCRYTAGNMFESVPAADAYLMKLILHDWNDEECVQILLNIRASAPDGAGLFVIEHLIPGPNVPHFSKLFDIHMICWGTGRERTADEYAALLAKAGWSYRKTWYPASQAMGIIEASAV